MTLESCERQRTRRAARTALQWEVAKKQQQHQKQQQLLATLLAKAACNRALSISSGEAIPSANHALTTPCLSLSSNLVSPLDQQRQTSVRQSVSYLWAFSCRTWSICGRRCRLFRRSHALGLGRQWRWGLAQGKESKAKVEIKPKRGRSVGQAFSSSSSSSPLYPRIDIDRSISTSCATHLDTPA